YMFRCRCSSMCLSNTCPTTSTISTLSLHDALPICAPRLGPPRRTGGWASRGRGRVGGGGGRHGCRPPVHARRRGGGQRGTSRGRSEEHTSELQSRFDLVCRPLLEKKKITIYE